MHELVVIGAGPAGLAAASEAALAGCPVTLLDAYSQAGGQYFKQTPAQFRAAKPGNLQHDWSKAQRLLGIVRQNPRVTILNNTAVWTIQPIEGEGGFRLYLTGETAPAELETRKLILAPGAYDRVLPFPGWDLPGVMTAGAAQTLVKSQRVLPGRHIVLSGSGPFLLPVAAALAQAGATIAGVFEATTPSNWARYALQVRRNLDKLGEGFDYLKILRKHRIALQFGRAVIRAEGNERLERVTVARLDSGWRALSGSLETLEADTLALGYGFLPSTELAGLLGCSMLYDSACAAAFVQHSVDMQTSVPGVFAAGEITGIGGSAVALPEGALAGINAAAQLGYLSAEQTNSRSLTHQRELARRKPFATILNNLFAVQPGWQSWLTPKTTICRCEEVPYSQIKTALEEFGAQDAKSVKSTTRCGMGLCQGRFCGHSVAALTAAHTKHPPAEVGSFGNRPIVRPLTLAELASPDSKA